MTYLINGLCADKKFLIFKYDMIRLAELIFIRLLGSFLLKEKGLGNSQEVKWGGSSDEKENNIYIETFT